MLNSKLFQLLSLWLIVFFQSPSFKNFECPNTAYMGTETLYLHKNVQSQTQQGYRMSVDLWEMTVHCHCEADKDCWTPVMDLSHSLFIYPLLKDKQYLCARLYLWFEEYRVLRSMQLAYAKWIQLVVIVCLWGTVT